MMRCCGSTKLLGFARAVSCLALLASHPDRVSANSADYKEILEEIETYACLSPQEAELFELINRYRQSEGLPPIPNSRSLNKVARIHVLDLYQNRPADGKDADGEVCNLHSWSDKGFWTPFCSTHGPQSGEFMWKKPREITNYEYPAEGYENAYWTPRKGATPSRALEGWKNSPSHNELILEKGMWKGVDFQALGVGIYRGFAVIWVGHATDALGGLEGCNVQ